MAGGAAEAVGDGQDRRHAVCQRSGLLTAECKTNEFSTYLEITVNGNPADPRVDDITGDLGAASKPIANGACT